MVDLINCSVLVLTLMGSLSCYEIPEPTFKVYRIGFDVSIPYEDGIELFVFTAHIISNIQNYDLVTYVGMARHPDEHGYLTYKNNDTVLTLGAIVNYWIDVKKNGENYGKANFIYTVRSYEKPAKPQYIIPPTTFKIYRKGFEVSIPHEDGIEGFEFSAIRNSDNQSHCGLFACIEHAKNGRWVYTSLNAKLELGEVIYYWVGIQKNGIRYYATDLVYTIQGYEKSTYESKLFVSFPYQLTNPTIKIFRKGFEMSIPHGRGIQKFAFAASLNAEIRWPSSSSWMVVTSQRDANGRYSYKNNMVKLQIGDTIYYHISVLKDRKVYLQENCRYTVSHYQISEA